MSKLKSAFTKLIVSLPIAGIKLQREVIYDQRRVQFYKQIAASIEDIGLIEPLVVFRQPSGEYLLLDGHLRLDALKRQGKPEVDCIIATEDEAYTYNRRVNSIPSVAQHVMLLKAIENGVTEERIAASLRVDVSFIRRKRDMLDGICPEVVKLLQTRKVGLVTFTVLKRMKPLRQVEAAKHMIASSVFSSSFARALFYATKPDMLVKPQKARKKSTTPETATNLFTQESETILRDLKSLEAELGKEALTLTVFRGYIRRLVANPRVQRYLERKHRDILEVLRSGTEIAVQRDGLPSAVESA